MTYNPNVDSGYVDRKNWVQVPSAIFLGIDQSTEYDGTTGEIRSARNYAQLVYQVSPTQISGDVNVVVEDIVVSDTYSRIVEMLGTNTYIAHAETGSLSTDPVWRVQLIDTNGSRQWADGNNNFDNVATSPLSALTYSY